MAQAEPKKRTGAVKKAPSEKKNKPEQSALTRYLRETRGEMSKVTWPTREEAQRLTVIVMAVLIVFALFLGLLDFGWSSGIEALVRFIIGA